MTVIIGEDTISVATITNLHHDHRRAHYQPLEQAPVTRRCHERKQPPHRVRETGQLGGPHAA